VSTPVEIHDAPELAVVLFHTLITITGPTFALDREPTVLRTLPVGEDHCGHDIYTVPRLLAVTS
jgi:hypothetical protein